MYKLNLHCRACGYGKATGPPGIKAAPKDEKLVEVLDLGLQPPANNFCGPEDERSGYAPLKVLFCPKCCLAQLSVVVKPDVLYSDYPYVTSKSATMQDHFKSLWAAVLNECTPKSVVEIGSNDGDFLEFAKGNGAEAVCGIDPAENLVKTARDRGLYTYCGVFDVETASMAKASMPPIDLIMARHVFCHVDSWHAFMAAIDIIANKNTLIVIEVPYVMSLLENVEFDTIYHEHLSYMNLRAMVALLTNTRFRLHNVVKFPIHGGSIAIMIRRDDFREKSEDVVLEMLESEVITENTWKEFKGKTVDKISDVGWVIINANENGKRVVGYGASAKATVWLNALGITSKELPFVCDSTPAKWGKTIPGTDIRVVDEGALLRDLPEYAVLFAWNFKTECLEKNQLWRDKGGKFIIPVPEVHIA